MVDVYEFLKELAPLELEYADSSGIGMPLESYIKRIYDDYILISSPQKKGAYVSIPDGQVVSLIFKTERGFLSADSTVMGKQLDSMQGLNISFPHNTRFIERRAFVRVPFKLDIEITKILDIKCNEKEIFNAITNDISGSGLSYISSSPLDNYYDIHCKIYLDDGEEPLYIRCEHIATRENPDSNLISLAYVNISENQISRIVKACFKHQLQTKKSAVN